MDIVGPDSLPGSSMLSLRTDATPSRPCPLHFLSTGPLVNGSTHCAILRWRVTAIGASAIRVSAFQPSAVGFGIPAADPRTAGAWTPGSRGRHPSPEMVIPNRQPL